jgi:hypothetical protein
MLYDPYGFDVIMKEKLIFEIVNLLIGASLEEIGIDQNNVGEGR